MKNILFFLVIAGLILFSNQKCFADEVQPWEKEKVGKIIEGVKKTYPDGVVVFDCYEESLKSLLTIKVDFANQKVLEPTDLSWGKLSVSRNSAAKHLLLWNPKNEAQGFYKIQPQSGNMQICKNDYLSHRCREFQCYSNQKPLF